MVEVKKVFDLASVFRQGQVSSFGCQGKTHKPTLIQAPHRRHLNQHSLCLIRFCLIWEDYFFSFPHSLFKLNILHCVKTYADTVTCGSVKVSF